MTWKVVWTAPAANDLRRLDRSMLQRIHKSVRRYAEEGHGDVKRLQDGDECRLRVGDWRVRFVLDPAQQVMIILRVLPRGRAYR